VNFKPSVKTRASSLPASGGGNSLGARVEPSLQTRERLRPISTRKQSRGSLGILESLTIWLSLGLREHPRGTLSVSPRRLVSRQITNRQWNASNLEV
jgi:hypothetical protein